LHSLSFTVWLRVRCTGPTAVAESPRVVNALRISQQLL